MNQRHPIRARFEIGLTRMAFIVIPRLPRSFIVKLSRILGRLALMFSPKLTRIGRANIDLAFGDTKSRREKHQLLRHAFNSFALVTLDAFWFSRDSAARIARHVRFEPCFNPLFDAKPNVCVTAHYGNWEVMGMAITARGFPLHSVAKPLKNAAVDDLFIEARRRTGQQIIPRRGAVRGMLKALLHGDKVALVLDQNTREQEGGKFYPFFGLPVLVSTAAAALAIKTKINIFIGMMTPQLDGDYVGDFGKLIAVDAFVSDPFDHAVDALTLQVTRELEDFLRARPDHWLWMYKRWKYIPPGSDAARYPFYAVPAPAP